MLAFLEVSHLPSSSSFYSAVTQPLGLRYLSTETGPNSSITFGTPFPPTPVFQIRLVPSGQRPKRSHIVFVSSSPAAVTGFHKRALQAHPDLDKADSGTHCYLHRSSSEPSSRGGETRARITDFDDNTMDAVYQPYSSHSRYEGASRRSQSTADEPARIHEWNYDVARMPAPSVVASGGHRSGMTLAHRPASRYAHDDDDDDEEPLDVAPYPILRRSVTTTRSVYEPSSDSPRQSANGLTTSTVVGTLLGVAAGAAAGAALTYNFVRSDRNSAQRQEYAAPPPFSRRSTFPDPYPDSRDRFEVERTVEKIRYPKDYAIPDPRRPPPEYAARYSQVGVPRSKEADDTYDDSRSRHSRSSRSAVRTRSEAGSTRKPLLLADTEHRSHASSRGSRHPPIVQRNYSYESPDGGSYVSARSHRSNSTVRAPAAPVPASTHSAQVVARSRSGSRVATTTIKVGSATGSGAATPRARSRVDSYASARHIPLPPSAVGGSYVSARLVPLPRSGAGTSRTDYDDDDGIDDSGSIVPDDSISCVGSRRSSRY